MSARPTRRATVLYYCQHSVGLGHLVRSLAIAGALAAEFRVVLVSGGAVPAELALPTGVELVALPAIGATDGRGAALFSLDARLALDEVWRLRRDRLTGLLEELQPAALVIELFPFGRRKFARELLPLLEAATAQRPAPVVVSSVRDILVDGKANQVELDDRAVRRLHRYFDAVVVHADPHFATLDETFRPSLPLDVPVHYSGYVVGSTRRLERRRPAQPHVLVSVGGGKVGEALLRCAASAHRRHLAPLGVTTRIVTGPFLAPAVVAELDVEAAICESLEISRFDAALGAAMASASVSVSQCGYNTALDILRAGVPALVVPYDVDGETEQALRANRLAQRGVVRTLAMRDLTPEALSREVVHLLDAPTCAASLDLNGAATTACIVADLVDQRR